MSESQNGPLADPNNPGPHGPGRSSSTVNIGTFNYSTNDLDALRRLAEVSPDLASKVVEQRDNEDARANTSYRFGIAATTFLAIALLGAVVFCLVKKGIVGTIISVVALLAIALLIRVILTGEWSETSWFGSFVVWLTKMFGGKIPEEKPTTEE